MELTELPTSDETNDNIVVDWAPKRGLEAGKSLLYAYRITSMAMDQSLTPSGRTVGTFRVAARALGLQIRLRRPGLPGFSSIFPAATCLTT